MSSYTLLELIVCTADVFSAKKEIDITANV